jgi:sialate O-acetylesterase
VPEKAILRGNKVTITFTHTGKGLESKDGKPLQHFAIAGEDGRFVRAQASIKGKNKVEIRIPDTIQPKRVRYAWANDPKEANLQNKAGLPASPFEWVLDD